MNRLFLVAAILAACARPAARTEPPAEIRTIENTPINAIPVQPPQTLDQPAELRPSPGPAAPARAGSVRTTTAGDKLDELSRKMNLPFAPPIAMDPVDGSKVSLTPDTPLYEYKDKLYYFSSAKNRQSFAANPETYLKGRLSSY